MSQNESRSKGTTKGVASNQKQTKQQNLKQQNTTNNTNSTNPTNHHTENTSIDSKIEKDKIKLAESLKPTAEQIRLASLLNVKTVDPEINKKLKQVHELCPNKNQDEILIVLHDHEYDVDRTLNYLFDGGDISDDWKLAGRVGKSKQSPNQTFDETDDQHHSEHQTTHHNKQVQRKNFTKGSQNKKSNQNADDNNLNNGTNSNQNVRSRDRGSKYNNRRQDGNEQNLEEKLSNLELNTSDNNQNDLSNDNLNRNRRSMRGGGEGGSRVGPRGNARNGTRGGRGGAMSASGGFRGGMTQRRGNNRRNENRRSQNEFLNSNNLDQIQIEPNLTDDLNTNENLNEIQPNTELNLTTNTNEQRTSSKSRNDNLRDIGTWSNDQANQNRNRKLAGNYSNRFGNTNGRSLNSATNQNQLEDDEEWQGDLTQTQIFTASTQKKEFVEPVHHQAQPTNDFPIGHFNAEEATQKIKKAVGIGSSSATVATAPSVASTLNTISQTLNTQNETVSNNQQSIEQNQKTRQILKFPPSSKPLPPPSTKIPKSAVIMPDGSTSNSANFNLDVQFGVDLDTPIVETKENQLLNQINKTQNQPTTVNQQQTQAKVLNQTNQPFVNLQKPNAMPNNLNQVQESLNKNLNQQQQQKTYQNQLQQQANLVKQQQYLNQLQSQPNSQNQPQPQRQQYQQQQQHSNKDQLLNISPQNGPLQNKQSSSTNQQQSSQNPQVLSQLQQLQNNQGPNSNASVAAAVAASQKQNQPSATNVNSNAQNTSTTPSATSLPPPPGVGLVPNPSNQYLISLPFNQNFPYFDQSQLDSNSLMQMYNHLANLPPPGVGATGGASAPQYPISDSKFTRNEATNSSTQLNSAAAQLSAQQQQAPINLIPNLNNFPFFFHNYGYPNLYMPIPNGTQAGPTAANQPQFQNKPPYQTNFANNQGYDEQTKEYVNYQSQQAQSQMKTSSSNLGNVNDMNTAVNAAVNAYQKKVDSQQTGGYHTPPPTNFPNTLLNQQAAHPNLNTNQAPPQAQFTYIPSMIGNPGANIVHTGMQDRNVGNSTTSNMKPMPKTNYQNSWAQ